VEGAETGLQTGARPQAVKNRNFMAVYKIEPGFYRSGRGYSAAQGGAAAVQLL